MPSTAFVQGVSVDAPSVAEADGFIWILPVGACQPLPRPPGLRGTSALPPDYEVVAEVQVGETHRAPCAADPCSALWEIKCIVPTAKHKAHRALSGPALLDESLAQVDAEAGAGLLVDALVAVDQGAPAAMLGSHASGATAVLLNLLAPLLQLVQGGEAEARAIAPGVVSTSTGARPPAAGAFVRVLCLPGAQIRLSQPDLV